MTRASAFAMILVLAAATAGAQDGAPALTSSVGVGSRVRVRSTAIQGQPSGYVLAVDDKDLTLSLEGGFPLKIPVGSVTTVEASLGRKRKTWQGLAIGAVSGAVMGLGFKVDPDYCGPESTNFCSRGEAVGAGSLGFALIGAGVGALVKSDRWSPVTLQPGRSVARQGRSVGLQLALRF